MCIVVVYSYMMLRPMPKKICQINLENINMTLDTLFWGNVSQNNYTPRVILLFEFTIGSTIDLNEDEI